MIHLEAVATELFDHRGCFFARVDAHPKVVERILHGSRLFRAREQQQGANETSTHPDTVRRSRKNASCKHQGSNFVHSPGPKRIRRCLQRRPSGFDVVDQQGSLDIVQPQAPESAGHVRAALVPREIDLTLGMADAAQSAQPKRDSEGARYWLREKHGLVEAAPATAAPVQGYGDDSVDFSPEGFGSACEEPSEGGTELAAAFVFEVVDRVGDGAAVRENGAGSRRALEEGVAGGAERGVRGGLATEAAWGGEEVKQIGERLHYRLSGFEGAGCWWGTDVLGGFAAATVGRLFTAAPPPWD
jgi:hypothetical protein